MTMILDTRRINHAVNFELILENGTPEGEHVVFSLEPLTAEAYFKISEKQAQLKALSEKGANMSKRELQSLQKMIDDVVIPLVQPADRFRDYLDHATEVGRRMVLDNLATIAFPKVRVDE